MVMKLTMVSVRMGCRTHTKFVMLPVCPETGKVRVNYGELFNIPRGWCVGFGR